MPTRRDPMIPSLIFFNTSLSTRFGLPLFLMEWRSFYLHLSFHPLTVVLLSEFLHKLLKTICSCFSPTDYSITSNLLLYFWWNIIVVFSKFSNWFLDFLLNILDLHFTCNVWGRLNMMINFLVTWWCFFITVICFGKVISQISFEAIMSSRRSLQLSKLQLIKKL